MSWRVHFGSLEVVEGLELFECDSIFHNFLIILVFVFDGWQSDIALRIKSDFLLSIVYVLSGFYL
jgi:hypothetical protein